MSQFLTILLALITGVGVPATALVTYLVARRQTSGQIATSDAATLWAESQAMRRELRTEVVDLRTRVRSQDDEIRILRGEIRTLRVRLASLERTTLQSNEEVP